jgi:hypothetical protein
VCAFFQGLQHDNKGHKFTRHQWQQANAKVVVCEIQAHLKVSFSFVFMAFFFFCDFKRNELGDINRHFAGCFLFGRLSCP